MKTSTVIKGYIVDLDATIPSRCDIHKGGYVADLDTLCKTGQLLNSRAKAHKVSGSILGAAANNGY